MNVVIMGCGRAGSRLAIMLEQDGHNVTAVDMNAYQFERFLPETFKGRKITGNGIHQDVLRRAGIEQADAFVAVTAGDNRNVMAAQIAKHIFGVPRVVCRIYDPIREEMYQRLGLRTVSPTKVMAQRLKEELEAKAAMPEVGEEPEHRADGGL
jgi:trk system potassium uptake protein TrkA